MHLKPPVAAKGAVAEHYDLLRRGKGRRQTLRNLTVEYEAAS